MCDCDKENCDPVIEWRSGTEVCRNCGVVMQSRMIDESGGRYMESVHYSNSYDPYSNTNYGKTTFDVNRVSLKTKNIAEASEMPRIVWQGYASMQNISAANKYPSMVVDQAKEIFNDMHAVTGGRACKLEHMVASSLFFAFKINDIARTDKEIARVADIDIRDLSASNRRFLNELKDKVYYSKMATATNPNNLLIRCTDRLDTTRKDKALVIKNAADIMERVKASEVLEGKTPGTICATSMWLSLERSYARAPKPVTKQSVAEACGIKLMTLNKSLQLLIDNRVQY